MAAQPTVVCTLCGLRSPASGSRLAGLFGERAGAVAVVWNAGVRGQDFNHSSHAWGGAADDRQRGGDGGDWWMVGLIGL